MLLVIGMQTMDIAVLKSQIETLQNQNKQLAAKLGLEPDKKEKVKKG